MPYSEPTDLAIIACPGGEAFADAVITHLKHMYKHRFTLKNDAISKRYNLDKNELIQKNLPIIPENNLIIIPRIVCKIKYI